MLNFVKAIATFLWHRLRQRIGEDTNQKDSTPTQAIVACQKIVDANIESITENETDPDKAYESYVCFGDDPWIEGVEFSAFEYAEIKIKEVLKG